MDPAASSKQLLVENAKRALINLLVFALFLLIYLKGQFLVSWDLSTYLAYSNNVLNGRGLVDPTGTPVHSRVLYVLMLTAVQWLTGKSLFAIAVFEAAWSAALALVLLLIAQRLFAPAVAVAVTMLFVLTPGLIFWLPRHIDPVWPTLALISFLFLLMAREETRKCKYRFYMRAGAGIMAALAFSTKEMALALLLIPLIMSMIDKECGGWRGIVAFLSAFILCYGAITLVISGLLGAPETPVTINNHFTALHDRIGGWSAEGVWRLIGLSIKGLANYFYSDSNSAIGRVAPLWALGLTGLGLAALLALRQGLINGIDRFMPLLILAIAFIPFAAYCGLWHLRPSQNMIFIVCLYFGIGYLLERMRHWLEHCAPASLNIPLIAISASFLVLLTYQLTVHSEKLTRNTKDAYLVRLFYGKPGFSSVLPGESLAAWIENHRDLIAANGGGLVVAHIPLQHGTSWRLDKQVKMLNIPWHNVGDGIKWPYYRQPSRTDDRPSLLALNYWSAPHSQTPLFLLTQQSLERQLRTTGIRLAAITRSRLGIRLRNWLEDHFELQLIDTIAGGPNTDIFSIGKLKSLSRAGVSVDLRIGGYLRYIRQQEPWRLSSMIEQTFKNQLKLNEQAISQVFQLDWNKKGPLFVVFDH